MKWIKNSDGKPDAMLTFATLSWLVVSICVFLSMFKELKFGMHEDIHISIPDSTLLLGYLGATFGSYVARRYSGDKLAVNTSSTDGGENK
jgi:hypothetical protein